MQFESIMDICVPAVTLTGSYTYISLTNRQIVLSHYYLLTYLITYLHTYLLHGAESFLRS
jgi:hypothetical protein